MVVPQKIKKIGSGGFGVVYESFIINLGQHVAVKFFAGMEQSTHERERFEREVRIQSRLQHPNILPVITHDLQAEPPWFAMPLAQTTLTTEAKSIREKPERIIPIFRQILAGLKNAHDQGVIHRDLKPQNILLFDDDQVKIADFGLGKRINPDTFTMTLTYTHEVIGTLYYAPPEQMKGLQLADFRSDIFSLGKIFYLVLTGQSPLDLDLEDVDDRFRYIIDKSTRRKPENRFQTIDDLIEAFEAVTGDATLFQRSQANEQMETLFASTASADTVTKLDTMFISQSSNENLYQTYFPKIEGRFLRAYLKHNPEGFQRVLTQYDQHISQAVAYNYCDTVAKLYRQIFAKLPDPSTRQLTLSRILDLGVRYNRFYVQNIFCKMLSEIEDQSTALVAREVMRQNSFAIYRLRDKLLKKNLINILHQELIEIVGNEGEQ
ncbi:serine/threonine-protein kinase [Anaerolineales bacterium HSG25]|nr:serine/threonine-protein kinase [Anaerolineales bacterium HSG25]